MAFQPPRLGPGAIYLRSLEGLFRSNGDLLKVAEVEPQALWTKGTGPASVPRGSAREIRQLSALPQRLLTHGVGYPIGGTICDQEHHIRGVSPMDRRTGVPMDQRTSEYPPSSWRAGQPALRVSHAAAANRYTSGARRQEYQTPGRGSRPALRIRNRCQLFRSSRLRDAGWRFLRGGCSHRRLRDIARPHQSMDQR
jgi:hypothetical protein